jgi:hypothetical protein
MAVTFIDADLPPFRGIDPLHPMVDAFSGEFHELKSWARGIGDYNDLYRTCQQELVNDPGPGIYVYVFGGDQTAGEDTLYVGVTRNPHIRFAQHRRHSSWWRHAISAVVWRIDCRWHEGPLCTTSELDLAARHLEMWLIELFEPTENRALGPVT